MSRQQQQGPALSDPQTRDITAVFNFLDRDRDGHITPEAAIKLCERLGYHVDKADVRRQKVASLLSLPDVLGWCESYAAACQRSDELRLTQLFTLLQKSSKRMPDRNLPAGKQGQVVTRRDLRDYLESEQHVVDHSVLEAFVEEVRRRQSSLPGSSLPAPALACGSC